MKPKSIAYLLAARAISIASAPAADKYDTDPKHQFAEAGRFGIMPGRDYASTDHVHGTRNLPTACAALILSLKEKRLQITGAPRHPAAGKAK